MKKYYFDIVGLKIAICINRQVILTEPFQPFLTQDRNKVDLELTFEGVELTDPFETIDDSVPSIFIRDSYFIFDPTGEDIIYKFYSKFGYNAQSRWNYNSQESNIIYFNKNIPDLFYDFRSVFEIIGFENILLQHDSIILHCSFISDGQNGILFSGPSGIGKSTQADLWNRLMNFEIINGDRSGLRKVSNTWTAYGLPYAGSSQIYKNESAPIKAIFILEQDQINSVTELAPKDAVLKLFPEVTVHRWNPYHTNKALDLISDIINNVPVLLLKCRPNEDAVDTAFKYLKDRNLI